MNYRERWRQRRRREVRLRALLGLALVVLALGAFALASAVQRRGEVWLHTFRLGSPVYFSVGGNTAFCALPAGEAHALQVSSGRRRWATPFRKNLGFGAPPAVSDSHVIFVSDAGTVSALPRKGGNAVWEFVAGAAVRCPPLVEGGCVFVGSDDGSLYALDLQSGAQRWAFPVGAPINSGCAVSKGVVVFGTADGRIVGVDAASGQRRWAVAVGAAVMARPTLMGEQVLIGADNGRLYLLDPATGATTARADVPQAGLIRSPAVLDATRVYVATTDGWVLALGRPDLARQWTRRIGREAPLGVAVDATTLYCADGAGRLLGLDKHSGRTRLRWDCGERLQGSLAVANGLVLVGTAEGRLLAFPAAR